MQLALTALAILASLLPLVAASWVLLGIFRRLRGLESASLPQTDRQELDELALKLGRLTAAVAEGISHVDRAERRVETTLRSAQSKFTAGGYAHAGVDAEIANLPDRDGAGGEDGQLQLVPEDVEVAIQGDTPSGIPGMTERQVSEIQAARAASA